MRKQGGLDKQSYTASVGGNQVDTSGVLTADLLDKLTDEMRDSWDNFDAVFQPIYISSKEIKRPNTRIYWFNPISWFRYLRMKRNVMKIAVDINKSMPVANPYPSLSQTQGTDLRLDDPEDTTAEGLRRNKEAS